jgi:hypothetical protein
MGEDIPGIWKKTVLISVIPLDAELEKLNF